MWHGNSSGVFSEGRPEQWGFFKKKQEGEELLNLPCILEVA